MLLFEHRALEIFQTISVESVVQTLEEETLATCEEGTDPFTIKGDRWGWGRIYFKQRLTVNR
ncbi:hypothetical protein Oscil6304_2492 [Oscillatoria acuminata PCC 6304]|uniref:Uncharacterized protein n=1 Tax=Oscillatoria acuminata PCC 6304 TaxID=56110 RepID=K9TIX0_9CYAN|nr:hypothetical protein Oscil6304_2492 [Oscillatoria acuminata PCC 6304]